MGNECESQTTQSIKYVGLQMHQRLKDQYIQRVNASMQESERFKYVLCNNDIYKRKKYIAYEDVVGRQIITKLRIDHNVLKTSLIQQRKGENKICNCSCAEETIPHLLLECTKFSIYSKIYAIYPVFQKMSTQHQVQNMLNLNVPKNVEHIIVNYLKNVYIKRCGK